MEAVKGLHQIFVVSWGGVRRCYKGVGIKLCVLRYTSAVWRTSGWVGELYTDSQLYTAFLGYHFKRICHIKTSKIFACGALKLYKVKRDSVRTGGRGTQNTQLYTDTLIHQRVTESQNTPAASLELRVRSALETLSRRETEPKVIDVIGFFTHVGINKDNNDHFMVRTPDALLPQQR